MRSRSPAWFAFFYAIWGTPLPMAPYGSMVQTTPLNLRLGAPGLLFDQEYGLLAYAPVYILAATGLVQMWRAGGELRRQAIEITCCLLRAARHGRRVPHLVGRHRGAGPADRLGPAAADAADRRRVSRRAGRLATPRGAASAAVDRRRHRDHAGVRQDGLLINNGRDGTSALLDCWSPRWELWTLAPTLHRASTGPSPGCTRPGGWSSPLAAAFVLSQSAQPLAPASSALVAVRHLRRGAARDRDHHAAAARGAADAARRSRRARAAGRPRRLRRARTAGVDDLRPACARARPPKCCRS